MLNKRFSERLNKELDTMGVPETTIERIAVLAKLLKVPRFKAESLLNGHVSSNPVLLELLAQELEVSVDWLVGKSDSKSELH